MTDMDGLQVTRFSMPVTSGAELVKGMSGNVDAPWLIEGRASTMGEDQQGEIVLVKGLDLSYLDQGKGTFNWNHYGDKDPSSVIGIIQKHSRPHDEELYVCGKLLKSLPKAQAAYNLLKALDAEGDSRRMGMSIEGKVLHRHNKIIYKAWVKAVALTMDPVNPDTFVRMSKSFADAEYGDADDLGIQGVDVATLERALSIASTGGEGGGSILSPESVEGALKNLDYADKKDKKAKKKKKPCEKISKGYSRTRAIDRILSVSPDIPLPFVERIVDMAFRTRQEE